jgi:glycine/D-amino acid oxidase-like deaminating enzyme
MPVITPVFLSADFPKRADVVVIGAGIVGVSTALELQAKGLEVVVVEKGEVAAEQSSRNWGWCRQMGRDPGEIPLIKVSLDLWRGMNAKIGAETGYRTCGILYQAETKADYAEYADWFDDNVEQYGLSTRLLSAQQTKDLTPGLTRSWIGGLYTEDDGKAEPFIAVPAMAEYFKRQGGKIFTHCAARAVETAAGKIADVITERGAIKTDAVVLAGGYWSERFLGNLGVRFPQTGVVSSVMRTNAIDVGHDLTFAGGRFAARKRMDGGYTVAHNRYSVIDLTPGHLRYTFDFMKALILNSHEFKLRVGKRFVQEWQLARAWKPDEVTPFEQVRILDPQPHQYLLDDAAQALKTAYPAFKDMRVEETWAGMIDTTPDAVPVIDSIEAMPGLFLASGFSGHGFGLGPGAGQLMAEIVMGDTTCVDPQPFRFSRFRASGGQLTADKML